MRLTGTLMAGTATTALLAGGLLVGSAGTASAAPYDGTDPSATGCSASARTVRSADIGNGAALLELRYSSGCRTAWARITITNGNRCVAGVDNCAHATVHRNSDGAEYKCYTENDPARHSCYTLQVNDAGVTSYAYGDIDLGATSPSGRTGSY